MELEFSTPIEMPRATHYGNNYFIVYSSKIHRVVQLFSNLEYYNFLTLEINSQVEKFCEQPKSIEIIQNNETKHAIFDMWVKYKDGSTEFQEVKYSSELTETTKAGLRSQEQIRREEQWCKENGFNFKIRTEKEIIKEKFYLQNLCTIAARNRRYMPTEEKYYNPLIINFLEKNEKVSINYLINNKCLPIGNELNHICYMYGMGLIKMDLINAPFGMMTEVMLCEEN